MRMRILCTNKPRKKKDFFCRAKKRDVKRECICGIILLIYQRPKQMCVCVYVSNLAYVSLKERTVFLFFCDLCVPSPTPRPRRVPFFY